MNEAEKRRNEILDAAGELFAKFGYESTTTNQILERVGIARGTLYYHFRSKEDIVNALVQRENEIKIAKVKKIASDKQSDFLDRFFAIIGTLIAEKKRMMKSTQVNHNAMLHNRVMYSVLENITPIFNDLAQEGIEKGIFSTDYSYEAIEMCITYAGIALDERNIGHLSAAEVAMKIKAFAHNAKLLLGCTLESFEERLAASIEV